jgi:hypothetical protein
MILLHKSAWNIRESGSSKVSSDLGKKTTILYGVVLQKVNVKLVLSLIISYFRGFQRKYIRHLEAGKCG